jgi:hypothetical protein
MAITLNGTTGITTPGLSADSPTLFVDSANDRVGIGTDNPTRPLDIRTDTGVLIRGKTGTSDAKLSFQPTIGGRQLSFRTVSSSFELYDESASSSRMYWNYDGRTGINTNNPGTELHVQGTNGYAELRLSGNSGTGGSLEYYDDTTKLADIYADPSSNIVFRNTASNTERLRIDSSGLIGIGGNGTGSDLGVFLRRSWPAIYHFYEASDGTKTMITGIDSTIDYVKIGSLSNHRVGLVANNGEKISILPSGNIGIGTTNPSQKLHINGGNLRIDGHNNGLVLSLDNIEIQLARSSFYGYSSSYKAVIIGETSYATNSNVSIGYDLSINPSGSFTGYGDELVLRNNHSIITPAANNNGFLANIQFNRLGHGTVRFPNGLGFGSDTANANVLDDYEEGTWTPRLQNGSVAYGNYTPGASNYGWYRKIGTIVYYGGTLHWTAQVTAATGHIYISGLPFTAAAGNNRGPGTLGAVGGGLTFASGYTQWTLIVDPGANLAYIIQLSTNGASYSHYPTIGSSGIVYGFGGMYVASS